VALSLLLLFSAEIAVAPVAAGSTVALSRDDFSLLLGLALVGAASWSRRATSSTSPSRGSIGACAREHAGRPARA